MSNDPTDIKVLERSISELLKKEGYKKKQTSWYKEFADNICLINLQRSSWGKQYYINLGVLIKDLSAIPYPKVNECHLYGRLSNAIAQRGEFEKDLDFEDLSISWLTKAQNICDVLRVNVLPLLSGLGTKNSIVQFIADNENAKEFLLHIKAQELLGVKHP